MITGTQSNKPTIDGEPPRRTEAEIAFMLKGADPVEKLHYGAWLRGEIRLCEAMRLDADARANA